jgi:hypothetical protein
LGLGRDLVKPIEGNGDAPDVAARRSSGGEDGWPAPPAVEEQAA